MNENQKQLMVTGIIIVMIAALSLVVSLVLLIRNFSLDDNTPLLVAAFSLLIGNFGYGLIADAVSNSKLDHIMERLSEINERLLDDKNSDP